MPCQFGECSLQAVRECEQVGDGFVSILFSRRPKAINVSNAVCFRMKCVFCALFVCLLEIQRIQIGTKSICGCFPSCFETAEISISMRL